MDSRFRGNDRRGNFMSQVEMQTPEGAETEISASEDNAKFVPVAESIRYRKRAQGAEKKVEELSTQLAEAKTEAAKLSEQLRDIETEQKLLRKLAAAGAVDLEAAVVIAKSRCDDSSGTDVDSVIEQLKKEKQYLFSGPGWGSGSGGNTAKKTAGAKEKVADGHTILEAAAKRAVTTGNRIDLHRYLRLRRNFL